MKPIILTIVLLAAAAAGQVFEACDTQVTRYPAASIGYLKCTCWRGSVTFTATTDTMMTVTRILVGRGRTRAEALAALENIAGYAWEDEGYLEVSACSTGGASGEARVDILGPAATPLEITLGAGAIAVTGSTGPVEAVTDSGSIATAGTRGRLALDASNGGVTVDGHSGSLQIGADDPVTVVLAGAGAGDTISIYAYEGVMLSVPDTIRAGITCQTSAGNITCTGLVLDVKERTNNTLRATAGREDACIEVIAGGHANITLIGRP